MLDTIEHRHFGKVERTHVLQASDIHSIFVLIRAPLMVCIDPAARAELGRSRVEAIARQRILALNKPNPVNRSRRGNCPRIRQ